MFIRKVFNALLCLTVVAGGVQARNLFVLPTTPGSASPIGVYTSDPFASAASLTAGLGPLTVLATPSGSKYYLVNQSSSNTVVVLDGTTFAPTAKTLSFNGTATGADLTKDGRFLAVVAGGLLHVIDTSTDTEVTAPAVPAGFTPSDVVAGLDPTKLYLLSRNTTNLTSALAGVDLSAGAALANVFQIPGTNTGVSVGPNGFVYATAQNRVFELDPKTLALHAEIPLNGQPSKPAFTPDGKFLIVGNISPVTGSSVIQVDLTSKAVTPLGFANLGQIGIDKVIALSATRLIGYSQSLQKLYDIQLGTTSTATEFQFGAGPIPNVLSITASNEAPTPRYLFITSASSFSRVDTNTFQLSGQLPFNGALNNVVYAGPAGTGTVATILPYNNNQTVAAGLAFTPLTIRVLDATGRPVFNAPVTFSSSDTKAVLSPTSTTTNSDGFATLNVTASNTTGAFIISAAAGSLASAPAFNLTVGGTTGGGGGGTGPAAGSLTIVAGNGQLVREQFPAVDPFSVLVKDTAGNPVPNAQVIFTITQGPGTLSQFNVSNQVTNCTLGGTTATCATDANGIASVSFRASSITPSFSFLPVTVVATYGTLSATFTITTYLNTQNGIVFADPTVVDVAPVSGAARNFTIKAGAVLPGALQDQIVATSGPNLGQGIPNVALQVNDPSPVAGGPTAACVGGMPLSNAAGLVSCDLQAGGKVGTVTLRVSVGSFNIRQPITVTVTPGDPAALAVLQGNNQSGNPGQTLPAALVAQVSDGFGNILPNVPVTFSVVSPGSLTLKNTFATSDASGKVSTLVALGSNPGPQQVKVSVGTASATFTETVNIQFGGIAAVSGGGQSAGISQPFAQALTVKVMDANGNPVSGAAVAFAVTSGTATLSSSSATTDATGTATVSATAGTAAGASTVTATVGTFATSFNLTTRLPGPQLTAASFVNAASFQPGLTPGGVVSIIGAGIAPSVQGVMNPNILFGSLPTSLAGVDVKFGNIQAPIYSVSNVNGVQQVTVQVPFELSPGPISATVTVNGGSQTVDNIPVLSVQPGIFETADSTNRRYAVAIRPDGSYITPANPARRGESVGVFTTGFGQTTPPAGTNRIGVPGEQVIAPVIVGFNGAGVPLLDASALPGLSGVYLITFAVPADAPTGNQTISFNLTGPDGTKIDSNTSNIAVQ